MHNAIKSLIAMYIEADQQITGCGDSMRIIKIYVIHRQYRVI